MGFFSDIGNFISHNVIGSAINDVTSVVGGVLSTAVSAVTPIVSAVAPLAGVLGLSVPNTQLSTSLQQSNVTGSQDIQQLNANQQQLAHDLQVVNNTLQTMQTPQNTTPTPTPVPPPTPAKTTIQKITDSMKTYWYWYAGGAVAIIAGVWYYVKNRKPKYRKKW